MYICATDEYWWSGNSIDEAYKAALVDSVDRSPSDLKWFLATEINVALAEKPIAGNSKAKEDPKKGR